MHIVDPFVGVISVPSIGGSVEDDIGADGEGGGALSIIALGSHKVNYLLVLIFLHHLLPLLFFFSSLRRGDMFVFIQDHRRSL